MRNAADVPGLIAQIDHELSGFLAERRNQLAGFDSRLADAGTRINDYLAGGKRLRPVFCWWGWRAAGGREAVSDCRPVLRVAAALELIQACALLHDDLIDRSDTRRGRPAEHRAAAKSHTDAGWVGDAEHFGVSIALLLGDLALAWADDLFVSSARRLSTFDRALEQWQHMRTQVLAGQLLDIVTAATPTSDPDQQYSDALEVIANKTAGYTVTRPLLLGAVLGGGGTEVLASLERYGAAVGTAFQLRDDLLGVFGDPAHTGKSDGDDLREGKRTALLALARRLLTDSGDVDGLELLDTGIGNADSAAEVDSLRLIIARSGAPDRIEEQIAALLGQALAVCESIPGQAGPALADLAHRAARRRS